MSQSRLTSWLNQPVTLLGVGGLLFLAHFALVLLVLGSTQAYRLEGKWITIPGYEARLVDPTSVMERAYARLNGWDGQWYFHIAHNGYHCPEIPERNDPNQCNVGFFPMLPLMGSLLHRAGVDLFYALPIVSQAAWLGSVLLLLLVARSFTVIRPVHLLLVMAFMSYPGSLYAFTSYAESMLTFCSLLVFALSAWYLRKPRKALLIALSVVCALGALTKATALLVAGIPLLVAVLDRTRSDRAFSKERLQLGLATLAGVLALLGFLVFCQIQFGSWSIYFDYVLAGWKHGGGPRLSANPFVILKDLTWHEYPSVRVANVSLVAIVALGVVLLIRLHVGRLPMRGLISALILCALGWTYFYAAIGRTNEHQNMDLLRHLLPGVGLTSLGALLAVPRDEAGGWLAAISVILGAAIVVELQAQVWMLALFRVGAWVS